MDYQAFCHVFGNYIPPATVQGERYYLLGADLKGFTSGEQRKPHALGLPLGMGRDFVPSLALLRLLAEKSERKAVINDERSEWLFVCGRDLFTGTFTTQVKDGFVLVQNKHNENLGLGMLEMGQSGVYIKNIVDCGNYLRHDPIRLEGKKPRKKNMRQKR